MAEGKFVSYLRVSTARQGSSGLGLEAQREAVSQYLNGGHWELLEEFVEVETGKGSNALDRRPQLKAALEYARKHKATLLIAKLDRLARNVAFISQLMEVKGVEFVAVDQPMANRLTIHILAAVAEHEARATSQRTKDALAAAKARGTILGANGRALAEKHKADALERILPLADTLRSLRAQGFTVRAMVAELNAQGVTSPGGGSWHPANLHRALGRLELTAEG